MFRLALCYIFVIIFSSVFSFDAYATVCFATDTTACRGNPVFEAKNEQNCKDRGFMHYQDSDRSNRNSYQACNRSLDSVCNYSYDHKLGDYTYCCDNNYRHIKCSEKMVQKNEKGCARKHWCKCASEYKYTQSPSYNDPYGNTINNETCPGVSVPDESDVCEEITHYGSNKITVIKAKNCICPPKYNTVCTGNQIGVGDGCTLPEGTTKYEMCMCDRSKYVETGCTYGGKGDSCTINGITYYEQCNRCSDMGAGWTTRAPEYYERELESIDDCKRYEFDMGLYCSNKENSCAPVGSCTSTDYFPFSRSQPAAKSVTIDGTTYKDSSYQGCTQTCASNLYAAGWNVNGTNATSGTAYYASGKDQKGDSVAVILENINYKTQATVFNNLYAGDFNKLSVPMYVNGQYKKSDDTTISAPQCSLPMSKPMITFNAAKASIMGRNLYNIDFTIDWEAKSGQVASTGTFNGKKEWWSIDILSYNHPDIRDDDICNASMKQYAFPLPARQSVFALHGAIDIRQSFNTYAGNTRELDYGTYSKASSTKWCLLYESVLGHEHSDEALKVYPVIFSAKSPWRIRIEGRDGQATGFYFHDDSSGTFATPITTNLPAKSSGGGNFARYINMDGKVTLNFNGGILLNGRNAYFRASGKSVGKGLYPKKPTVKISNLSIYADSGNGTVATDSELDVQYVTVRGAADVTITSLYSLGVTGGVDVLNIAPSPVKIQVYGDFEDSSFGGVHASLRVHNGGVALSTNTILCSNNVYADMYGFKTYDYEILKSGAWCLRHDRVVGVVNLWQSGKHTVENAGGSGTYCKLPASTCENSAR